MRDKKTDCFYYSVLPIDPEFPDNARPPLLEAQQLAFDDVIAQLIRNLVAAAKDKSDPLRPMRILYACQDIIGSYRSAGLHIFETFEHELKTDLHNALRTARRLFLRQAFVCHRAEYPKYLQVMRDAGWMYRGEAREDFEIIERELFDDTGRLKPAARAERRRNNNMN